ncbi:MAG TPA: arginase family protein [Actinomycetota bacterium]|nr:arginase family protein [Actinomycetota bacterium]
MFEIIEVPSGLGLLPQGVDQAPAALRHAGLPSRLGATAVHTVTCPDPDPAIDEETGLMNVSGLVDVATRQAEAIEEVLDRGATPFVVGGDCSILLGSMLALRRRGRHGLLHVDGHADFCHPSQDPLGEAASLDLALVTGRGPKVVTDLEGRGSLLRDEDAVQLGYRAKTLDRFLDEHIRDTAITVLDLDDIRQRGIEACTQQALAVAARPELDGMWLHLDVDALDDALMPAVDYHDADGLSWQEVEHVLRAASGTDRLVGAQIAIYNPTLDGDGAPLAARIVDLLAAAFMS